MVALYVVFAGIFESGAGCGGRGWDPWEPGSQPRTGKNGTMQ
jgi:hypothetical protein